MNMHISDEIMEILKRKASEPHDYINPHFLSELEGLLFEYYQMEDATVEKWIRNMWGA